MKYQSIKGISQLVSRLVQGCMRLSELSVDAAEKVIQTNIEAGINFFDHADIYGQGASEKVFSTALKQSGISRSDIILQSKVGIRKHQFDFSYQHIITAVEGCLERLQTDYLDVLLLHRPDTLMEPEEVAEAFNHLYHSGKVRVFGVSNHHRGQIELLQKYVEQPLCINQLQFGPAHTPLIDEGLNVNMLNEASVMHTGGLLEFCRLHDITIQPWSPFQIDLQKGLWLNHPKYANLTRVLQQYALEKETTIEGMVMAWILRHPAKMQPIIGSMNTKRIQSLVHGVNIKITRQEWYDIYLSAGNELP